jgi:hypothetical protein
VKTSCFGIILVIDNVTIMNIVIKNIKKEIIKRVRGDAMTASVL